MGFDMAQAKAQNRQVVHSTLAVPAFYDDDTLIEPVAITVRWHNKLSRAGALEGGYGVEIIEGIDRLVFNEPELTSKEPPLTLIEGGTVTIPSLAALAGSPVSFTLESEEPGDGPVSVYWSVSRDRS